MFGSLLIHLRIVIFTKTRHQKPSVCINQGIQILPEKTLISFLKNYCPPWLTDVM